VLPTGKKQRLTSNRLDRRHAFMGQKQNFHFDDVRFAMRQRRSTLRRSVEGHWNREREEFPTSLQDSSKEGYFPVSPMDTCRTIRPHRQWLELRKQACRDRAPTPRKSTLPGQAEIDIVAARSNAWRTKMQYTNHHGNFAKRHNRTVNFMPNQSSGQWSGIAHPYFALESRQNRFSRERIRLAQ